MTSSRKLEPAAFFSYARADDDHDRGYLTDLRRALAAEVSAQTGEDFLIFQDRDDILWGQRWRQRVEQSINSSTVLFAVLTPRFFRSDACREEVERFRQREQMLGQRDLILPLYYLSLPQWGEASPDALVRDMASRQFSDWRDLRFERLDQPDVRRRIAGLASHIVSVIGRTSETEYQGPPIAADEGAEVGGNAPGFIELVTEAEDAMPLFSQTMTDFALELDKSGEIAREKTVQMEKANFASKPMAARLFVVKQLAEELADPAERMETLAADYLDQLARVDGGIRALVGQVATLGTEEEVAAAQEFSNVLSGLRDSAVEGLGSLEQFRRSLKSVSQMSSSVRPVIHRMDSAVAQLLPSRETFRDWSEAIDRALGEAKIAK